MTNTPPITNPQSQHHSNAHYFKKLNKSLESGMFTSGIVGGVNLGSYFFVIVVYVIAATTSNPLISLLNLLILVGIIVLLVQLFKTYKLASKLDNFQFFTTNQIQKELTYKISLNAIVASYFDLLPIGWVISMIHKTYLSRMCKKFNKNLVEKNGQLLGKHSDSK